MVATHPTARRARDDVARDGTTENDDARAVVANALRAATNHRTDARAHRRARFTTTTTKKKTISSTDRTDTSSPTGVAHDRVPTDWTLKSSARLSSATSFRWMAGAGARATADGLRAYAGGQAVGEERGYREDKEASRSLEATHRAMVRASYSCAYPASPMTEAQATTMAATASGAAWMRERASMWVDALVSLYGLLRAGRCHAFYVVYKARTVLFCAPGVGGAAGGFAVATNGDAKLRRALHDASVEFTSADEEALAIDRARAARARPWRAEDENIHEDEDDEARLLDGLAGGDASRAAGDASDAPGASRRRAADTIVCRGAIAVSGLVNVLIDAEGGDPGGSDASARDVPTLLAPVPFAHGCMRPVKFHPRTNATTTTTHGGETHHGEKDGFHALAGPSSNATTMRATYSAETGRDELIPPWTLERVCAAAATRHDAFTVACSPHLATRGLNVGVLAAKDMFGARDATNAMELESGAYYDAEETKAIATAPSAASVLRVEYSGGKYYIP